MRRIIYASIAATALTAVELDELHAWSRVLNEEDGVTGLLLYFPPELARRASFLQLLEGPEDVVEATFERIRRDQRHHDVRVIARVDAGERLFPNWTVGVESVTREDLAAAVPGLPGSELVVMAQLVEDPVAAEQLLRRHCVRGEGAESVPAAPVRDAP